MILEVIRMVADGLNDEGIGVNFHLAGLPRDADDPAPPEIVEILDSTRHREVIEGGFGPNRPIVVVEQLGPATAEGEVMTVKRRASPVSIQISYVTSDADQARDVTDTLYTLRAILKSLRDFLRNENDTTFRQRNNICLLAATNVTWGEVREDLEQGAVRGIIMMDFQAEDIEP